MKTFEENYVCKQDVIVNGGVWKYCTTKGMHLSISRMPVFVLGSLVMKHTHIFSYAFFALIFSITFVPSTFGQLGKSSAQCDEMFGPPLADQEQQLDVGGEHRFYMMSGQTFFFPNPYEVLVECVFVDQKCVGVRFQVPNGLDDFGRNEWSNEILKQNSPEPLFPHWRSQRSKRDDPPGSVRMVNNDTKAVAVGTQSFLELWTLTGKKKAAIADRKSDEKETGVESTNLASALGVSEDKLSSNHKEVLDVVGLTAGDLSPLEWRDQWLANKLSIPIEEAAKITFLDNMSSYCVEKNIGTVEKEAYEKLQQFLKEQKEEIISDLTILAEKLEAAMPETKNSLYKMNLSKINSSIKDFDETIDREVMPEANTLKVRSKLTRLGKFLDVDFAYKSPEEIADGQMQEALAKKKIEEQLEQERKKEAARQLAIEKDKEQADWVKANYELPKIDFGGLRLGMRYHEVMSLFDESELVDLSSDDGHALYLNSIRDGKYSNASPTLPHPEWWTKTIPFLSPTGNQKAWQVINFQLGVRVIGQERYPYRVIVAGTGPKGTNGIELVTMDVHDTFGLTQFDIVFNNSFSVDAGKKLLETKGFETKSYGDPMKMIDTKRIVKDAAGKMHIVEDKMLDLNNVNLTNWTNDGEPGVRIYFNPVVLDGQSVNMKFQWQLAQREVSRWKSAEESSANSKKLEKEANSSGL